MASWRIRRLVPAAVGSLSYLVVRPAAVDRALSAVTAKRSRLTNWRDEPPIRMVISVVARPAAATEPATIVIDTEPCHHEAEA